MEKKLLIPPNGANLIVMATPNTEDEGKILCVRANYGAKQWMLPGGTVERSETSLDAAVSELNEETGLITRAKDLQFLGLFFQTAGSNVSLFLCERYTGTLFTEPDDEIADRRFMTIEEIVECYKEHTFGRAYAVMAVTFDNMRSRLTPIPTVARMFDPVAFQPKAII